MQQGKGRKYWAAVIERFEESGLSQREFCSRNEIPKLCTFRGWLYRFRKEALVADRKTPRAFLEVTATRQEESAAQHCQLIHGRLIVDFEHLPPADYLATVLTALARVR